MNDILNAIVLGIVQGLTEFLPVSSSGHLEIAKLILGDDASLLMTVMLHGATALSTLLVFRKEIGQLIRGIFSANRESLRYIGFIVLSMVPAVIVGLIWENEIEALFNKNLLLVGAMLIVTAILLLLADRAKDTTKHVGPWQAIVIGLAQAVAILPGISRSGATIATSVMLGIDRERAARFSFLMVIPLIFGKISKDIIGGELSLSNAEILPLSIGFLFSFVTGVVACTWMIKLVKNSSLKYFSFYCIIVAIAALIMYFT